jgi:hypothetical protein
MIALVLVYCLVADGSVCMEKRPVLSEELTPEACMMTAQKYAIPFVAEHPQWRLAGWRCEVNVPRQDES